MKLRQVDRREREKLFKLLQFHLRELRRTIGKDLEGDEEVFYPDFALYFQEDRDYRAYFLEHEDQIGGFVLINYAPADEFLGRGTGGKILRIAELHLTPLHRGEGYGQFVFENMLSEAERKRMPLCWEWPKADYVMNKLFERFCHWATKNKAVECEHTEFLRDGIEYKRYLLKAP